MHKFLIVIEKTKNNYSAFSPDLPGCIATGKTVKQTEKIMFDAIELHLHGLKEEKYPIPTATSIAEYIVLNNI